MGALDQAEKDLGYEQNVAFGDMEFEMDVGSRVGPITAPFVDADKAHYVPTEPGVPGYNLRGFYVSEEDAADPDYQTEPSLANQIFERIKQKKVSIPEHMQGENGPWQGDKAYAVGSGAGIDTWAHEFGHRRQMLRGETELYRNKDFGEWEVPHDYSGLGYDKENLKTKYYQDYESAILLERAYYARTLSDWAKVVQSWALKKDRNRTKFGEESAYKRYINAEKHLKNTLDQWQSTIAKEEVRQRKIEKDRPKSRKNSQGQTVEGSLRKDADEGYKNRSKYRNYDEYTRKYWR
jgi:hypothetical protein